MGLEHHQNLELLASIDKLTFSGIHGETFDAENIIGIGIDVCEVQRMKHDVEQTARFVIDTFTDEEIVYCEQPRDHDARAQRYAARFAAKEAVVKALGGVDTNVIDWHEISVLKGESGKPYVLLDGRVAQRAQELGVSETFLSLTHTGDIALAWCIAVKGTQPKPNLD